MLEVDSCAFLYEVKNGTKYRRLSGYMNDAPDGTRCRDCGMLRKEGNAHHPDCDAEACPACHMQALGCDCEPGPLS